MTRAEAIQRVISCFDDAPDRKPSWLKRFYEGADEWVACETDRGHIALWIALSGNEKIRFLGQGFGVVVVEVLPTDTAPRVRGKVSTALGQAYERVKDDGEK